MSDKSLRRRVQERLGFETRTVLSPDMIHHDEYLFATTKEWTSIPWYETEIEMAWELVEKMVEGQYVKVNLLNSHYHGCRCQVISAHESQRWDHDIVRRDAMEAGVTMPEAICKAFLGATGPEEPDPVQGTLNRLLEKGIVEIATQAEVDHFYGRDTNEKFSPVSLKSKSVRADPEVTS